MTLPLPLPVTRCAFISQSTDLFYVRAHRRPALNRTGISLSSYRGSVPDRKCPGPEAEPEHGISSDKTTARRTGQKLIGRKSSVILLAAATSCLKRL
jgi:hypothetical protein